MAQRIISVLFLLGLLVGLSACGAEKSAEKTSEQSETKAPDLSSEESAANELIAALKADDKEAFRQVLSPRLQKKAKECEGKDSDNCKRRHSLDAMFNNWKKEYEKTRRRKRERKRVLEKIGFRSRKRKIDWQF